MIMLINHISDILTFTTVVLLAKTGHSTVLHNQFALSIQTIKPYSIVREQFDFPAEFG